MVRRLYRDVAAGVAGPDHEHPFAGEGDRERGRLVLAGMERCPRERAGNVGPPRLMVVAIGDDHARVVRGPAARDMHDPA